MGVVSFGGWWFDYGERGWLREGMKSGPRIREGTERRGGGGLVVSGGGFLAAVDAWFGAPFEPEQV